MVRDVYGNPIIVCPGEEQCGCYAVMEKPPILPPLEPAQTWPEYWSEFKQQGGRR